MNRSPSPLLLVLALALALAMAACQTATQTDVGDGSTAAPTAIISHAPIPTSAGTATDGSTAACTSPEPAAETNDWPLLESADERLSLRYPAEWQDISGMVSETIQVAFDQETHAESGLPPEAELEPAIVRSAANAFFLVSELESIASSATTLHDRHVAKVEIIGDDVLEAGLERCLDGEVAAGFTALNTDGSYYQSWFISRGGVAYHALGLDPADEDALDRLMDQMLSTWTWTR